MLHNWMGIVLAAVVAIFVAGLASYAATQLPPLEKGWALKLVQDPHCCGRK